MNCTTLWAATEKLKTGDYNYFSSWLPKGDLKVDFFIIIILSHVNIAVVVIVIIIIIIIIISNGNRTEWTPIQSVIILVVNSESPICLISSMVTDRIGWHEVLLPINHDFNKICDIVGSFFNQNTRNPKIFFACSEKKSHLSTRVMARPFQLLRHG